MPKPSLSAIALFRTLEPDKLQRLEERCQWRNYQAEAVIIEFRDSSRDVFFIVSGSARVSIYSIDGDVITYRDVGAGAVIGELAAIDGQPRSATVLASSPSVVASLSEAQFNEVLDTEPKVARALLVQMIGQIRSLTDRVFEFSALPVKDRVHAELLRLAEASGVADNRAILKPAPGHAQLASRISTHREAVTRELGKLAKSGLIEREGNSLVILDVDGLKGLVHEASGL